MIGKDINRLMESNQRRLAEKDQEIESLKSMIRSLHRKLLTIRHATIDENIKKYTFFRKYKDKKVLSKKEENLLLELKNKGCQLKIR